ncbi:hypothetical protein LX32DRAFT_639486, partial [Colletotrichum zoysiae]
AEGHSAPWAAYWDFVRTGPEAVKLGFWAIINREFDSLFWLKTSLVMTYGVRS